MYLNARVCVCARPYYIALHFDTLRSEHATLSNQSERDRLTASTMYLTSAAVPGGVSGGCCGARSVALPENFGNLILDRRVKALSLLNMRKEGWRIEKE